MFSVLRKNHAARPTPITPTRNRAISAWRTYERSPGGSLSAITTFQMAVVQDFRSPSLWREFHLTKLANGRPTDSSKAAVCSAIH